VPDNALGTNTQIGILEEKLDSLRRQVISITVMGVLVLGVLIWMEVDRRASAGHAVDTIEAHNFVVRDSQGQARAVLQSMDPVGVQLAFFRDPQPSDTWRDRAREAPYSFGVRSWRGNAQMVLNTRDGEQVTLMPSSLSMSGRRGVSLILYGMASGDGRIDLRDSTGTHTTYPVAPPRMAGSRTRRR
jgi:hypothetical protein